MTRDFETYRNNVMDDQCKKIVERGGENVEGAVNGYRHWCEVRYGQGLPVPRTVMVLLKWTQSRIYGLAPTSFLCIPDGSFGKWKRCVRASGCGYDRTSTAVAGALNECDALVQELGLEYARRGGSVKGSTRELLGYDCGDDARQFFVGGQGMGALRKCMEAIGYEWCEVQDISNVSLYVATRKGA